MVDITCRQARKLMSLELDGLTVVEDEQRLQAHVVDCPGCRVHWAYLTMLVQDLRAVEMVKPPATLAERVLTGVLRCGRQSSPPYEANIGLAILLVALSAVGLTGLILCCGVVGVLNLPRLYDLLADASHWLGSLSALLAVLRAVASAVWNTGEVATRTPWPAAVSTGTVLSACLMLVWAYVVSNWRGIPAEQSANRGES